MVRGQPSRSRRLLDDASHDDTCERDRLFVFLASDSDEREKALMLIENWKLLRTCEDVECVFLYVDVLNIFVDEMAEHIEEAAGFISYCVMVSEVIRSYVLDELLFSDFIHTCTDRSSALFTLRVLTACAARSLEKDHIDIITDYALSVTDDFLVQKLLMLRNATESLCVLPMGAASQVAGVVNLIVTNYLNGGKPAITSAEEVSLICEIAKKVSKRIGPERAGFRPEIWRQFLERFHQGHEIVKICHCEFVVRDYWDLPYKVRQSLNTD